MASLKKKKGGGGGGANWMDTYGDMVTLLLCFFVLLYSMSTIDQEKFMMIVQSFNKNAIVNTEDRPLGPDGENDEDGGNALPALSDTETALDELAEFLASMVASQGLEEGTITVTKGDGYVFLSFRDSVFFGGDSYALLEGGQEILDSILPALDQAAPYIDEIVVTGHTATSLVEYNTAKDFRLSTNRAVSVAAYLLDHSMALDPARMATEGHGQWRPVADNKQASERAKNRRVEMMITGAELDEEGVLADSLSEYYTSTNQEQPEETIREYYTSTGGQTAATE